MATTVDVATYLESHNENGFSGEQLPTPRWSQSICDFICERYEEYPAAPRPTINDPVPLRDILRDLPDPETANARCRRDLEGYKRYQKTAKIRLRRAWHRWYYSPEGPGWSELGAGGYTPSGLPIPPGDPSKRLKKAMDFWQREVYFMDCIDEVQETYEGLNVCCNCTIRDIESCIVLRCMEECNYDFLSCEGSC